MNEEEIFTDKDIHKLRELIDGGPGPDQLYIESWRLAVQLVSGFNHTADRGKAIEKWQAYFLERLKGGTDGK